MSSSGSGSSSESDGREVDSESILVPMKYPDLLKPLIRVWTDDIYICECYSTEVCFTERLLRYKAMFFDDCTRNVEVIVRFKRLLFDGKSWGLTIQDSLNMTSSELRLYALRRLYIMLYQSLKHS